MLSLSVYVYDSNGKFSLKPRVVCVFLTASFSFQENINTSNVK